MTAKEKAIEIYYLFDDYVESKDTTDNVTITDFNLKKYNQKQCALIAVDEITTALIISTGHLLINKVDENELVKDFNYWNEVKTEIEKL